MSDFAPKLFRAVLLRGDTEPPRVIALPTEADAPPNRIRVPSDFAGASAFEVYELADDRAWPEEATYRMTSSIPRSTDDFPSLGRSESDFDSGESFG